MAQAIAWSSRITTICLEMVLPALIGHWLDQWLGTGMVLVVVGAAAGMIAGMVHLVRIANAEGKTSSDGKSNEDGKLDR